jgi:hypothetical protein
METKEILTAPQTLEEKYNDLITVFGSEQAIREELTHWFRNFVGEGEYFKLFGKIERDNFVWRYSRIIEYFTGNNPKILN